MKTLVACDLPDMALDQLRALAVDLVYQPRASSAELRELIGDVSILVVANTRVSPEMIARADGLQMIVRAGPGPGEIAIDEASAQGIFVTHCPLAGAEAVAELTFAHLLALDRRLVDAAIALREGRWTRGELETARGLAGRTLGILGFNAVGRLVADRARAFGMHVLAWTPRLAADDQGWTPGSRPAVSPAPAVSAMLSPESRSAGDAREIGVEVANWPRDLARRSDFVTVHALAGDADTEVLIDADFLEQMRPGAGLVLMGSAAAVDDAALVAAIEQRGLRVGVDVFPTEPATDVARFRCRLCELPTVIATPHIGPLTEQARLATAAEVVRLVEGFVVSGELSNCLNLADRSPATWQLVLRVRDQVGVMAAILEAIRADGINAQEITSRVFTGAKAAWCTIALDERPSTEALASLRGLRDVLHLELRAVV